MKKMALLCSFFLLLFSPLMAQTLDDDAVVPDDRLSEFYPDKHIQKLLTHQPEIISYWNYFLDNSYVIEDLPTGKSVSYPNFEDLAKVNPETSQQFEVSLVESEINVLLFNLRIQKDRRTSFRLGDTGKVITFYSKDEFIANYNAASATIE